MFIHLHRPSTICAVYSYSESKKNEMIVLNATSRPVNPFSASERVENRIASNSLVFHIKFDLAILRSYIKCAINKSFINESSVFTQFHTFLFNN